MHRGRIVRPLFQNHVHAEVMRIAEERQELARVVPHAHELLDEAFAHSVRGVFLGQKRHAIQFQRVLNIEFVLWHSGSGVIEGWSIGMALYSNP
jgi:hypothetical protein